jgi:hypothetical protein
MPRKWVNVTLFLSSYLPLFILVGVRSIGRSTLIVWVCVGFVVAAVIGTAVFLAAITSRNQLPIEVTSIENRDGDVAGYAATYLLPFVTVFTGTWQDLTSLLGFIGILGIIYVRSRLIYINPTLALLGFHLSRLLYQTPRPAGSTPAETSANDWPRFIITRRSFETGATLICREVSPDLLFLAKDPA